MQPLSMGLHRALATLLTLHLLIAERCLNQWAFVKKYYRQLMQRGSFQALHSAKSLCTTTSCTKIQLVVN